LPRPNGKHPPGEGAMPEASQAQVDSNEHRAKRTDNRNVTK
jgi:hypothetical protein